MLDVTDRLVVIIGGGKVAARKAGRVLECGASRVRCVSPTFAPNLRPDVERVPERYQSRHLDGAGLVFAVTDAPEVNEAVVSDARARGVLVCRSDAVDEDDRGDFTTPVEYRNGGVVIAVSSGSPTLSAQIVLHINAHWDARLSRMADALRVMRPEVGGRSDITPARRAEIHLAMTTDAAFETFDLEGLDGLRRWLAGQFPELKAHG